MTYLDKLPTSRHRNIQQARTNDIYSETTPDGMFPPLRHIRSIYTSNVRNQA